MISKKNIIIDGAAGKPIAIDVFANENSMRPVVIYAHGFNGFKDWGNFDLVAEQFAEAGFAFVKFNFSHNGTTLHHPEEFVDLHAFGENNYSKELYDLQQAIDWVCDQQNPFATIFNTSRISLIGHSRGGGICIIKASEDPRITSLVTWASVAACKTPWGNWSPEKMSEWKSSGVSYYANARTKQEMPLYYQLYLDYVANAERLDVCAAMQRVAIPTFICHGIADAAVPVEAAHELKESNSNATLLLLDTDHVFGRKHPWHETSLPPAMQELVHQTIAFLKR